MSRERLIDALGLAAALAVCLGAGALGGLATSSSVETWYPTLGKPPITPPGSVIGIVWTVLYTAMAVAVWRVWRAAEGPLARPLGLFGVQLALNVLWSVLFFGLQSPGIALLEIVLLWVAIAATIRAFDREDALAVALMAPYLAWVTFAAVLNGWIWILNGAGSL